MINIKKIFNKQELVLYDGTIIKNVISAKYKSFNKENCEEWARNNYKEISDNLSEEEKEVLMEYCKEDKPIVNFDLRRKTNSNVHKINMLRKITNKRKVKEHIIVYRITDKNYFEDSNKYREDGFMSTSLIDGDINTIHKGNYKYIILINRSIKGFYADFISCRYGEFELLFPDGMKLKKIRKYKDSKSKDIYLCKMM